MTPKQETEEGEDQPVESFTAEDGTVFFPAAETSDGRAMWRVGNEMISEDALLEFADDFDE